MGTFNELIINNYASQEPEVDMGATIHHYTDRTAVTIIWVSVDKKTVITQDDWAHRIDGNGMSEMQDYRYERNPGGVVRMFKWHDGDQRWLPLDQNTFRRVIRKGDPLMIGDRRAYHDYSF